MRHIVLFFLAGVLITVVSGCATEPAVTEAGNGGSGQAPSGQEFPDEKAPGNWAAQDPDSEIVREAVSYLEEHKPQLSIETVEEAYTQVVAGTNIRLIARARRGEEPGTVEAELFIGLDDSRSITEYAFRTE